MICKIKSLILLCVKANCTISYPCISHSNICIYIAHSNFGILRTQLPLTQCRATSTYIIDGGCTE